jgi:hypothetical protein
MPVNPSSKTLSAAQEAEIARKLGTASRHDHANFVRTALAHEGFCAWFRRRYAAEPMPELITPAVRDAFMIDWERQLRADCEAKNERERQAELDDDDETDATDIMDRPRPRERESEENLNDVGEDDDEPDPAPNDPEPDFYVPPPSITYVPVNDPGYSGPKETAPEWQNHMEGDVIRLKEKDPRAPFYKKLADAVNTLPDDCREHWDRSHTLHVIYGLDKTGFEAITIEPNPYYPPSPEIEQKPAYQQMVAVAADILAQIAKLEGGRFKSVSLDDIEDGDDDTEPCIVPGVILAGGQKTYVFGDDKDGKSLWLQKLSAVVATPGATLDGLPVMHGPVLYISADTGAKAKRVKNRLRIICERMGLPMPAPHMFRLVTTDHSPPPCLDVADSVSEFIADNPGHYALVIIDPEYKCVSEGSDLAQPGVISKVIAGLDSIARATACDAMVIVSHTTKTGDDMYGGRFQSADADGMVRVERHTKGGIYADGDPVSVTTIKLKNDPVPTNKPLRYRIEGAYLAPVVKAGDAVRGPTVNRADLLRNLPTDWTALADARAKLGAISDNTWLRLRSEWQKAGLIEQRGGTKAAQIRRRA